jgi:hypothetical protein
MRGAACGRRQHSTGCLSRQVVCKRTRGARRSVAHTRTLLHLWRGRGHDGAVVHGAKADELPHKGLRQLQRARHHLGQQPRRRHLHVLDARAVVASGWRYGHRAQRLLHCQRPQLLLLRRCAGCLQRHQHPHAAGAVAATAAAATAAVGARCGTSSDGRRTRGGEASRCRCCDAEDGRQVLLLGCNTGAAHHYRCGRPHASVVRARITTRSWRRGMVAWWAPLHAAGLKHMCACCGTQTQLVVQYSVTDAIPHQQIAYKPNHTRHTGLRAVICRDVLFWLPTTLW